MTEPSVEERLDELQRQSEERRCELVEIASQLPHALSRRAVLRAMAADFRHAPGKSDVARRALVKAARAPGQACNEIRHWLRRRGQ